MSRSYFYRTSWRRTVFACIVVTAAQVSTLNAQALRKTADDDGSKYTTIGNVGMTITNFGTIGNRFLTRPVQPSCQHPKGSGVEHLSLAGIWFGAISHKNIGIDPLFDPYDGMWENAIMQNHGMRWSFPSQQSKSTSSEPISIRLNLSLRHQT